MGVATQTAALIGLRCCFFLVSQQYLQHSLYSGLKQVIREETAVVPTTSSSNGSESPDSDFPTSPAATSGYSLRDQLHSLRSASGSGIANQDAAAARRPRSSQGNIARTASSSSVNAAGSTSKSSSSSNHSKGLAPKVSSAVFCVSVSECLTLFALLLFGGAVDSRTRLLNWELSLGAVLALIVLVIPFGMCLLFSLRSRIASSNASSNIRRILLITSIPFSFWIIGLYTVGAWIGNALGVQTTSPNWSFGLLTSTLERICVPGTVLIAALSGGAAVNSAWEAFEWRERSKSAEVVTEGHINAAARSLNQTRMELEARNAELIAAGSATSEDGDRGFFSKMFTSSPHAARIKALQAEITGLEAMESQMTHDLQLMKKRKEIAELGQTWYGKFMQAVGWMFSLYCVYRIVISLINLIFGSITGSSGSGPTRPSDLASSILGKLADAFGWNIDVATWSKVIGLILIGSIIVANLNFVLGYVSRVFRATSAGNSASFMLLFLSQLLAVYLITSLISLPSVEDQDEKGENPSAILLDTLPDFRVFQRIFDGVFLVSAMAVFGVRWLRRKIIVDEHLGLQDFV